MPHGGQRRRHGRTGQQAAMLRTDATKAAGWGKFMLILRCCEMGYKKNRLEAIPAGTASAG